MFRTGESYASPQKDRDELSQEKNSLELSKCWTSFPSDSLPITPARGFIAPSSMLLPLDTAAHPNKCLLAPLLGTIAWHIAPAKLVFLNKESACPNLAVIT
ncbi:hypothetical protein KIL84_008329 [Mauremys mutica]|uniref:Uncharacterized protein n=1 Tax=Mauremys mutica TaxID=74926 RepID=A0A9D4B0C3_9SAUR|nr:hypothetical protein KIL84_008329 [Mauremys mutica]